jgi:hypothetical protein
MTTRGAEYRPVKVAGLFDNFRRYKDSYELRFRKVGVKTKDSTSPCFCRRLSTFTHLSVVCPGKMSQIMMKIPVIVLTGSNRDRDLTECRRLGAVFYILKPVEFQNFSEVTPRLSLDWMLIKPNTDMPAAT